MSNTELIPSLASTLTRRLEILGRSVDLMDKLQARLTEVNISNLTPLESAELLKHMSHQFVEVLEAFRRCSSDEVTNKLEDLKLYQLIREMKGEKKQQLISFLETLNEEEVEPIIGTP